MAHRSPQIWKLNPETLELEWVFGASGIAGAIDVNEPYKDSHDAKLATAIQPKLPVHWNGAWYFWDHPIWNGNDHRGQINTLRRWVVGAGVSTVTPSMSNPTGLTSGTGDGWFGDANADGLPKVLNDDVLVTDAKYFGNVVYDNWLYTIGRSWEDFYNGDLGYTASWIKRLDLNNPDNGVETLYYGLSRYFSVGGTPALPRDWESDFADTPEGAGTYHFGYVPGKGTPDLYGFMPGFQATVVNDDLLFDNVSLSTTVGGVRTGTTICAIHIPTLLDKAANGPLRHDRANPLFRIIANGGTADHSYSLWNIKNQWAVWNTMDGGNPALTHVSVPSLHSNPNSPDWAGKALYMNSSIDNFGGMPIQEGVQSHLVHVLEPKAETSQSFNVEFSFEGQILKGYGPAAGITLPDCPEEVTLL